MKRYARITVRVLGWILLSVIGIFLIVYLLIQTPAGQNFARKRVVVYLENKLHTKVEIGRLSVTFPRRVVLENVFFADQRKDTLLAGKRLQVDIDLFKLLSSEVIISHIGLEGIRANINRISPDTAYNFDYIIKAFATPPKANSTDTSSLKIQLNTIALKDVITTFHDDVTGNDMFINIGELNSRIDTFNPDKMIYSIPVIQAKNVVANIRQYKPLIDEKPMAVVEAESNQPKVAQVRLHDIDLSAIKFNYNNTLGNIKTDVQLGRLIASINDLNMQTMNMDVAKLQLDSTKTVVFFGRTPVAEKTIKQVGKEVKAEANNPWKIKVDQISFANNDIKYDDENTPRVGRGIDYAHLDAKRIYLDADNIIFTPTRSEGSVNQFAFNERSGLVLKETRTDFIYTDNNITLSPLFIRTDKSIVRDRVELNFPSLARLAKDPGSLVIKANIEKSTIAVKDLFIFAPMLATLPPFKNYPNDIFYLDAEVRGMIRDLYIPHLAFEGLNNTKLALSGHIKGLPNPNSTFYDLTISNVQTNKKDILNILPPNSVPSTVQLPNTYSGSAAFRGTIASYNIKANLRTDRGAVNMIGFVGNNGNSYTAKGTVTGLDVGYIFKQKDIGKVSAYVNVKGSGFDPKTATIVGDARVMSAYYNGYTYKNIVLDGELRKGLLNATAKSTDPNVAFDVTVKADLNSASPSLQLSGSLANINLQLLNLSKDPLLIHANVNANLTNADPDNLQGTIIVKDISLTMNGTRYHMDSMSIVAGLTPIGNKLTVSSESLALQLEGKYKLTEIATALQTTINRYYAIPGFVPTNFAPQNWTLTAIAYNSPLLNQLAPQIRGTDSLFINASFNSLQNDLRLAAKSKTFVFNGNKIDSMNLTAATTPDRFNYSLTALHAGVPNFTLDRTSVTGFVANNRITLAADVKDSKNVSKYQLAGTVQQIPGGIEFSLQQGSVMFNYEQWTVGSNNFIRYTDQGLLINNFVISNNNQSLSLQSDPMQVNAPVLARFTNFKISTITRLAEQQGLLMDGTINGTAVLKDVMSDNPSFTSDLLVNDFQYKGDTLGNISMQVRNENANTLIADVKLTSGKNDVRLSGKYIIDKQAMDMQLNVMRMDLATVLPFSQGQIRTAGGSVHATATVQGTISKPIIRGEIGFDSAFIAPTFLGERFSLPNQTIKVTETGFALNNFTLQDSTGNKAILDGQVTTTDYQHYNYNLYMSMANFRLVNTKKQINQMFYGQLTVDSELEIWGSLESPNVDGYVRVNKATDFAFILPGNNPELVSREGVVRFIDVDNPGDTVFLNPIDTLKARTGLQGLNLFVDVSTDTSAQLAIVIDERNGDILKFRGRGDLAAGVDRSGKISLTGTYELVGGSYEINFSFLKRRFDILRGSYVTWTGEPTTAQVNINATYTANTASIDLVEPQLVGRSPAEINRYKQRLDFIVTLSMTGEILKPVLQFDIGLPETQAAQWRDVNDRLEELRRDDAEMNKQVFALLLLNRFVSENPFQSAAGTSNPVSSFARQSVSRLLSEQLNNLAGNLIKGVDLNFGVMSQEDFTTGERLNRTDLTVGVSKQLMNDRLRVSVGSNFELEGPQNTNASKSNIAGDVQVDYQLSRDGRYMLRAYRRNQYDFIVEGQVVETGVSFIFSLDFDSLRELFRKSNSPVIIQRRNLRTGAPIVNKE